MTGFSFWYKIEFQPFSSGAKNLPVLFASIISWSSHAPGVSRKAGSSSLWRWKNLLSMRTKAEFAQLLLLTILNIDDVCVDVDVWNKLQRLRNHGLSKFDHMFKHRKLQWLQVTPWGACSKHSQNIKYSMRLEFRNTYTYPSWRESQRSKGQIIKTQTICFFTFGRFDSLMRQATFKWGFLPSIFRWVCA